MAVIYFLGILAFLFCTLYAFCRALLFLYFPYPRPLLATVSAKIRNGQWRRFVAQTTSPSSAKLNEQDSDSNGELNAQQHKIFAPTRLAEWINCLFLRYHPVGIAVYWLYGGRNLPVCSLFCLFATACYHCFTVIIYVLIMYGTDSGIALGSWLSITIPCSVALIVVGCAGLALLRRAVKRHVSSTISALPARPARSILGGIMPRGESSTDLSRVLPVGHFSKEGQSVDMEQPTAVTVLHSNDMKVPDAEEVGMYERRIRMGMMCACVAVALCLGFSISSSRTLTSTAVWNYLITFMISWGMDLLVLRVALILSVGMYMFRSANAVSDCNDLVLFEFWSIPSEDDFAAERQREIEKATSSVSPHNLCDLSKPQHTETDTQLASMCGSAIMKELRGTESRPGEMANTGDDARTEQTRSDFPVDSVGSTARLDNRVMQESVDKENRLETVRDDVEGENLASMSSPQHKLRHELREQDKEQSKAGSSVDRRARMLWGFHDILSSKQTSPMRSQRPGAENVVKPEQAIKIEDDYGQASFAGENERWPSTRIAMLYCSPTKGRPFKENLQPRYCVPDNVPKTSPKRPKRTFAYDGDMVYMQKLPEAFPQRNEDPELRELVRSIKESVELCCHSPKVAAEEEGKDEPQVVVERRREETAKCEEEGKKKEECNSNDSALGEVVVMAEESKREEPKDATKPSAPAPQRMSPDVIKKEEKIKTETHAGAKVEAEPEAPADEVRHDGSQLFQKLPSCEMQKISLFGGRQSAISNESDHPLVLESIADFKTKSKLAAKPPAEPIRETVLDVSDFDPNADAEAGAKVHRRVVRGRRVGAKRMEEEESESEEEEEDSKSEREESQKGSARDRSIVVASQRARITKWIRIAEAHDRPDDVEKLKGLLMKLKLTRKPLRGAEMKEFEMLETLDLPYATHGSMPVERPLTTDRYGSRGSTRGRSRGKAKDPARLNVLYMVYSNNRPNHEAQNTIEPPPLPELKKQLPPLKVTNEKTKARVNTEPEMGSELANDKHLAKIDKIIGQCFDKVRKSFGKLKPRQGSSKESGKESTGLVHRHEKMAKPVPRRSMSKVDAHLLKLAN